MHLAYICPQALVPWSKAILQYSQNPFWDIFLWPEKSGHEMTILISLMKSRKNAFRTDHWGSPRCFPVKQIANI